MNILKPNYFMNGTADYMKTNFEQGTKSILKVLFKSTAKVILGGGMP